MGTKLTIFISGLTHKQAVHDLRAFPSEYKLFHAVLNGLPIILAPIPIVFLIRRLWTQIYCGWYKQGKRLLIRSHEDIFFLEKGKQNIL